MTIDIMKAIAAKSDQLNADDLIAGPRTIRISGVKQETSKESRINIFFDGDDGKPWKPAKTVLRVLAAVWGLDDTKWIGMHCTIFRDETVPWAGEAVGGIRVSHMEGLSKPRTLMLTKTRGKKEGVTIQPLVIEQQSKSDKFRARLFEIAEGAEKSVKEVWDQVPADIKADFDDGLYDQLIAIETAAQEHRENDPTAAVDSLNAALTGG